MCWGPDPGPQMCVGALFANNLDPLAAHACKGQEIAAGITHPVPFPINKGPFPIKYPQNTDIQKYLI